MEDQAFYQPATCRAGGEYYLKSAGNGTGPNYRPVEFLAYRPCPAEVLVREGARARVAYRIDLYQKVTQGGNGKAGT